MLRNMTNDEIKEYDDWNMLKKQIHLGVATVNTFPKEREIWMASLGKNIGFEQNGIGTYFSRPLLVVKKFNNNMFWCVPLSTKQKNFDFYYNFTDPNNQNVSAILAQLRLAGIERLKRKLYEIPDNLFIEIKERLRAFIS